MFILNITLEMIPSAVTMNIGDDWLQRAVASWADRSVEFGKGHEAL